MSKHYTCDFCKENIYEPEVMLRGVVGVSGGILLPEKYQERHFCSSECFWNWAGRFSPYIPSCLNREDGST